jgi:CRISPR-associated protein Csd2
MNNPTPHPPTVPRITGLLILEVRKSNPNGDPERESSPRQRPDGKGEISPVSIKRKLRDLVEDKVGDAWVSVAPNQAPAGLEFDILEHRGRNREQIKTLMAGPGGTLAEAFMNKYWDARLFGNTFLEEGSGDTIRAGVAHFGVGVSVAPIEIEFSTWTSKAGVESGKDRGMAPMAFRVLKHGIFAVPFFVNPSQAHKTGCTVQDVEIMLQLLPHIYSHNPAVIRTQVYVRHAHVVRHAEPVGSFSDFTLLDKLTPKRKAEFDATKPSESADEYQFPTWDEIKGTSPRPGRPIFEELGTYHDYAL